MKNKVILLSVIIVFVVLVTLGCIQYHKVNAEFQDYELKEEKIKLNQSHDISVGTMQFSNLSYKIKEKEIMVSADIKIVKKKDYPDQYYNNIDANLFLRVNNEILQQSDEFKLKSGKRIMPDRSYFDKHNVYEGRVTFRYMPLDSDGDNDLELSYLDRNGHKLKKLYFPIKVDGGKIV
ncbi:hypothetical protein [Mammaliicoccus fleurettii]|uniref:hypothetical protein n=1 Tax=Mammaliicoccus fleurettii TaxID=150056 RepID=UPI0009931337|nr:hypothetical protein [Mammaliicoccus fleurettii]MEB7724491.1 hypothetical protein [Mammaliicoccus fleurettii]OOV76225.1 hypothetical protein B2G86_10475 [Mammaliicoccus fleurettii]